MGHERESHRSDLLAVASLIVSLCALLAALRLDPLSIQMSLQKQAAVPAEAAAARRRREVVALPIGFWRTGEGQYQTMADGPRLPKVLAGTGSRARCTFVVPPRCENEQPVLHIFLTSNDRNDRGEVLLTVEGGAYGVGDSPLKPSSFNPCDSDPAYRFSVGMNGYAVRELVVPWTHFKPSDRLLGVSLIRHEELSSGDTVIPAMYVTFATGE